MTVAHWRNGQPALIDPTRRPGELKANDGNDGNGIASWRG